VVIRQGALEGLGMNPAFWKGKRVFLTGHTGFKGSWLCLWLQHLGAEVTGYALQPHTQPNLFEEACVADGMKSIIGDVRDLPVLEQAMLDANPEIVFHMAAQSLVRYSYASPVETFSTNVIGTVHLLEAVRKSTRIKSVVVVTTDKCYENQEWIWGYRENDRMGGYDPYSSSKACAELATAAYRSSYFNPEVSDREGASLATARCGNVIGGGDWATDRLIPDILQAYARKSTVNIRNPYAIRPWVHVLDSLRGYLLLAEQLYEWGDAYAEAWNFGGPADELKTVGWIANTLADYWGQGAAWETDRDDHPHESATLVLDTSKARSRLGWKPQLTLEEALGLVVEWERKRQDGSDVRTLTVEQIQAYQNATSTTIHG
jgi:CDP-glucose 4,6-dehydratase